MNFFDANRFFAWKDRLFSNPTFHAAATAFPLTRRVARRYEQSLFDLCSGFVYSQILFAAVQLDLFRTLKDHPQSRLALAAATGLAEDRLTTLLDACVSIGLLEHRSRGRYGLAVLGAAVLANPEVEAMVRHHALLYADLADPARLIRAGSDGTRLAEFWSYVHVGDPAALDRREVASFSHLMAISQSAIAEAILDAYPLKHHQCLLDIGGGEGVFMSAALRRAPRLRGLLFDLPAVADRARQELSNAGLAERVTCCGGDFFADKLPRGADIASLVRVAFDHGDDNVLALFTSAFAALRKPGRIVIAEPIIPGNGKDRISSAYFAFYLMAMGHGRARSCREICQLLIKAGFSNCRSVRTRNLLTALVIADAH